MRHVLVRSTNTVLLLGALALGAAALPDAARAEAEAEATAAEPGAKPAAKPAATTAAKPGVPTKASLYKKWKDARLGDAASQRTAYETGLEFLKHYGPDADQYVDAVKGWVARYAAALAEFELADLAAQGKHDEAFAAGRKLLAANPDDVKTLVTLAMTGLSATTAGNAALHDETAKHAAKVIQLIEAGKDLGDWRPVASKEDALGWMHYVLGTLALRKDPAAAARELLTAVAHDGAVKSDPQAYYSLATAWMNGEYDALSQSYTKRFAKGAKTAESDAAYSKLNAVLDRILAVHAKAVAMARAQGDAARADRWLGELTELWRSRHDGKDDGLAQLVDSALAAPLPRPS